MSESNFGESQAQFEATDEIPGGNPLVHWLGAFASAGVLAVMVYWGLQLVQRDPSEVPVIRAMEGPARVQPEDPGGAQSRYTGLAVNSVQSEGEAEKPSDRVVLAPAPRELLPEDVPVPRPVAAGISDDRPVDRPVAELILDSVESAIGNAASGQDAPADGADLVPASAGDGAATLTVRDLPDGVRLDTADGPARLAGRAEAAAKARPAAPAPGTRYAPRISLLPPVRRHDIALASVQTARKPARAPRSAEVPEVPLGTRLIQLGAYDSRETAHREWARLSGKHHDLLGGKNFVIQLTKTGGRQFYRLRAVGFANSTESKAMCSALIQRGALCIPVVAR